MQDEPMPFEQNEKTRNFIETVKRLIDSGEVKNQATIVEALGWDKTLMSNVMNGRKNVPNDVYRKFTDVFPATAPTPTDADYRDKYISLLEQRNQELERRLQEMGELKSNLDQMKVDYDTNFALLIEYQKYWLKVQMEDPKEFQKALRNIQRSALDSPATISQGGKTLSKGNGGKEGS